MDATDRCVQPRREPKRLLELKAGLLGGGDSGVVAADEARDARLICLLLSLGSLREGPGYVTGCMGVRVGGGGPG